MIVHKNQNMEDEKILMKLIVDHLKSQVDSGNLCNESLESMEIAIQCIESAYNLDPAESDNVETNLEEIVKEHYESMLIFYKIQNMEDEKKLMKLIVDHLKSQVDSGNLCNESLESMEIAVQCIESAYNLDPAESDNVETKLEEIVKEHHESKQNECEISQAAKKEAEFYMQRGNDYFKTQDFKKAIVYFSKSILLNPYNSIYYGNRAAVYNRNGQYANAVQDCYKAIAVDPNYIQAYTRLGYIYSLLHDNDKAVFCYKKACEIDPDNPIFQRTYQLLLNNLQNETQQQSQLPSASNPGRRNFMETVSLISNNLTVMSALRRAMERETNANIGD